MVGDASIPQASPPCSHVFRDSNRCLRCKVHIDELRAQMRAELDQMQAELEATQLTADFAGKATGFDAEPALRQVRDAIARMDANLEKRKAKLAELDDSGKPEKGER